MKGETHKSPNDHTPEWHENEQREPPWWEDAATWEELLPDQRAETAEVPGVPEATDTAEEITPEQAEASWTERYDALTVQDTEAGQGASDKAEGFNRSPEPGSDELLSTYGGDEFTDDLSKNDGILLSEVDRSGVRLDRDRRKIPAEREPGQAHHHGQQPEMDTSDEAEQADGVAEESRVGDEPSFDNEALQRPSSHELADEPSGLHVQSDDVTDHAHRLLALELVIDERMSKNRIDLAGDVPRIKNAPTYEGYLDVVAHGSKKGVSARVLGDKLPLSVEETATLIEESPEWRQRPIRLISCDVGASNYAQDLADRLGVSVYAPTEKVEVNKDGSFTILENGSWRRFQPMLQ